MTHAVSTKPIIASGDRLAPNYVWHLLAVARIGYDSEYALTFRDSVIPPDLRSLEEHGDLLRFGNGEGGELTKLLVFLPSWLDLTTEREYLKYFDILTAALMDRRYDRLMEAYPGADWSDPFVAEIRMTARLPKIRLNKIAGTLRRFGEIYTGNLRRYRDQVWNSIQPYLQQRAEELAPLLEQRDLIGQWENALSLPFNAERYEVILCYASKNGPDANSIGYSRNLFYFNSPIDRMYQFISHEVGTHMLIETYLDLARGGTYDLTRLYAAYETLAMFYNKRILDTDTLEYALTVPDTARFSQTYELVYEPDVAPRDLLIKAVSES